MIPELAILAKGLSTVGQGLGIGLAVCGAGIGIGLVAGRTMESIARQPDLAGKLQGLMFVAAALIEGLALIALVMCLQFGLDEKATLENIAKVSNKPAAEASAPAVPAKH